ncbi:hypothetical protein MRX96_049613 [Rhipicephalus microplus]
MQLPRRPVLVCLAFAAAVVGVFALAVLLVHKMRRARGRSPADRAACVAHGSTTEALLGHTRRAPVPRLGFRVGEHVLLYARIGGRTVMKPYTPVSRVDHRGSFDIMVKIYPAGVSRKHPDGGPYEPVPGRAQAGR